MPPVPFQMMRHSPTAPVSRFTSACWMYGLRTVSSELYQESREGNAPNMPRMGTSDVHLSVLVPKRLRVVAGKVEVNGVRPRLGVVRVLGLEDYL
jgi:hypothetical protein